MNFSLPGSLSGKMRSGVSLAGKKTALTLLALALGISAASAGELLTGTPIGTADGWSYEQNKAVPNIQGNAFDHDFETYFATNARSYTWVGLDLGAPHVIDRVGWSPRNDSKGPRRLRVGIIQGANSTDFLDAVPLYIIREDGRIGKMSYGDVNCSKGFRYVRFVSTGDSRCNIAELEFYGTPGEGDDSHYPSLTNLPTVCVNTVNAEEPYDKEHEIKSNIIIIADGKIDTNAPGGIRERGNASRAFPKKPWRLKFDKKQSPLDAPAKAKKWTLINNYGDKTLMRNLVAFEIARRVGMEYVPYGRPVDVVLNGEYKGCYQLCDQVEVNPGRVEITEMETTDISGETLTGGYFIEVDAYASGEPEGEWFETKGYHIPVTIKSPDDGGTPEQFAYIKNWMEGLEQRVMRHGQSGVADYREIFDVESFLQHFIVGELSGNTDTYWSTYMYKDRGSNVMKTGPVWDFDIAFDNDVRTYCIHDRFGSNVFLYESGAASAAYNMDNFTKRILKVDKRTKPELSRLWSLARNDRNLTYESMAQYVEDKRKELSESQKLNFYRWPIINQLVHQNPVINGSYNTEVNRIKTYLENRFKDLDVLMNYDATISGVTSVIGDEAASLKVVGNRIVSENGVAFEVYNTLGVRVCHAEGATPELPAGLYIAGSRKFIIR